MKCFITFVFLFFLQAGGFPFQYFFSIVFFFFSEVILKIRKYQTKLNRQIV